MIIRIARKAMHIPHSGRSSPVTTSVTTGNTTRIRPFRGGISQRYVRLANIRNESDAMPLTVVGIDENSLLRKR